VRALVTGGAGLIGSHSVDLLLERGWDVRVYDSLELPTHAAGKPSWVPDDFVHADVRDRDRLREALEGVDVILHLAATGGFTPRIADYVDVNALGTAKLLEIVRDEKLPIRKIVVASSIAVYGEGARQKSDGSIYHPPLRDPEALARGEWEIEGTPIPTPEAIGVDPATAYAITKYDQERMVLVFGRDTGIPTVALRYFVTYGPRQSLHNPYTGVCTLFSSRISNDLPIVLYEDGRQTRDFVFVKDVARANVFALEEERVRGDVYNVGTGRATAIEDLAHAVERALGKTAKIERSTKYRPADVRHMVADVSKLAALGWRARTTVDEGLREYVAWLSTLGPLPEYFGRAEAELRAAGIVRQAR
jgi:dTDP-L-rhamnose 4-epimerase